LSDAQSRSNLHRPIRSARFINLPPQIYGFWQNLRAGRRFTINLQTYFEFKFSANTRRQISFLMLARDAKAPY